MKNFKIIKINALSQSNVGGNILKFFTLNRSLILLFLLLSFTIKILFFIDFNNLDNNNIITIIYPTIIESVYMGLLGVFFTWLRSSIVFTNNNLLLANLDLSIIDKTKITLYNLRHTFGMTQILGILFIIVSFSFKVYLNGGLYSIDIFIKVINSPFSFKDLLGLSLLSLLTKVFKDLCLILSHPTTLGMDIGGASSSGGASSYGGASSSGGVGSGSSGGPGGPGGSGSPGGDPPGDPGKDSNKRSPNDKKNKEKALRDAKAKEAIAAEIEKIRQNAINLGKENYEKLQNKDKGEQWEGQYEKERKAREKLENENLEKEKQEKMFYHEQCEKLKKQKIEEDFSKVYWEDRNKRMLQDYIETVEKQEKMKEKQQLEAKLEKEKLERLREEELKEKEKAKQSMEIAKQAMEKLKEAESKAKLKADMKKWEANNLKGIEETIAKRKEDPSKLWEEQEKLWKAEPVNNTPANKKSSSIKTLANKNSLSINTTLTNKDSTSINTTSTNTTRSDRVLRSQRNIASLNTAPCSVGSSNVGLGSGSGSSSALASNPVDTNTAVNPVNTNPAVNPINTDTAVNPVNTDPAANPVNTDPAANTGIIDENIIEDIYDVSDEEISRSSKRRKK